MARAVTPCGLFGVVLRCVPDAPTLALMLVRANRARRSLLRLFVANAAVLLILAHCALAGLPYVWCIPAARAHLTSCCGSTHARRTDDPNAHVSRSTVRLAATDCCEDHRIDAVPSASGAPHDSTIATRGTEPVASEGVAVASADVSPRRSESPSPRAEPRAGPDPPLFVLNRSFLN